MLQIHLVENKDFESLSKIYVVAYNSLDIGERWDKESAEELLRHLYKEQSDLFFVAKSDENVVGAITAIIKPWWDGNHLTDGELFVDPDHQGKQIGKKLIKHLFEKAKEKYKAVSWDTFTHIVYKHPLSWYKKMGFDTIKKWTMITGDVDKVIKNLNYDQNKSDK